MTLSPEQARRLARALLSDDDEPGDARHIPRSIGRYRIVRHIGTGGMGEVYEAEQDNPRRRVALKVIRPDIASPEVLRRFDLESSILAKLQHPGIAQVFDAGKAQGPAGETPYFAMEFVEGRPLLEFAAALPLKDRLALFLKVCEAVEHAHRRGIIHRDLKPANILVDAAGQPRILDFGIARVTDADIRATTLQTDIGKLVGTLPYMSPEQAGGDPADLDTRSDVYSLGVILYELLAGKPPYEIKRGRIPEALRIIKEVDPAPLSTTNRTLRGDLETITSKSLAKERERRYQSVSDLAADLRRYLSDQPIEARPPSAMYQIRKFTRRNRTAVWMAGVLLLLLLCTTFATARTAYIQTRARRTETRLREQAQQEAATALAAVGFIEDSFKALNPDALGREAKLTEFLDHASKHAGTKFANRPTVHAAVQGMLGQAYMALGKPIQALSHSQTAYEVQLALSGKDHSETLTHLNNLGWAQYLAGDVAAATDSLREAKERRTRVLGPRHPHTITTIGNLAAVLMGTGHTDEGLSLLKPIIDELPQLTDLESDPAVLMADYATLLAVSGNVAEALPILERAVEMQERAAGPDDLAVITSKGNLSEVYRRAKRMADADRVSREVVEGRTRLLGSDHPDTMQSQMNRAVLVWKDGRKEEGLRILDDLQKVAANALPESHPLRIALDVNHGRLLFELQQYERADEVLSRALKNARAEQGDEHRNVTMTARTLIELYKATGQVERAESLKELAAPAPAATEKKPAP
jgi:tetratricopeptide (TPR) repeat protein/predicted Ser/Thr protein kinase